MISETASAVPPERDGESDWKSLRRRLRFQTPRQTAPARSSGERQRLPDRPRQKPCGTDGPTSVRPATACRSLSLPFRAGRPSLAPDEPTLPTGWVLGRRRSHRGQRDDQCPVDLQIERSTPLQAWREFPVPRDAVRCCRWRVSLMVLA